MRVIGIIVALIGVVSLIFGIIFITQAGSAEKEIAASIAPLTLSEVNPKYDAVAVKYDAIKAAEEPQIQAGKALPTVMYDYLAAQRALLGQAKASIGTAQFVRTSGVVDLILGIGLIVAGLGLLKKNQSKA